MILNPHTGRRLLKVNGPHPNAWFGWIETLRGGVNKQFKILTIQIMNLSGNFGKRMDISNLLGGIGIGSLLTVLLKEYFDNKKTLAKRKFEEKREAYTNYLNVAALSQTMLPDEGLWARTAAIARIKLCGSEEVVKLLDIVSNTTPNSSRKPVDELIKAMRKDLF